MMAYRIAIATSDGTNIDGHFGSTPSFKIYEVEGDDVRVVEDRQVAVTSKEQSETAASCGQQSGCGGGGCGHGHGGGCGGDQSSDLLDRIEQLSDCRSVVCKKIGFQAQKTMERRAVSSFEVDTTVEEALRKITFYFGRIDRNRRQ